MSLKIPADWRPTHRHRKGGLYRLLGEAVLETNRLAVAIYDEADGTVWVRPLKEFEDGRFTPIATDHGAAGST